MNLPPGGKPILDARIKGYSPASEVLISFVGDGFWSDALVTPRPDKQYDWRFLKDLNVAVFSASHVDLKNYEGIARYATNPVQVFQLDVQTGFDAWWSPTERSMLLYLDERISKNMIKFQLDTHDWVRMENAEWSRWVEERTVGTHTGQY